MKKYTLPICLILVFFVGFLGGYFCRKGAPPPPAAPQVAIVPKITNAPPPLPKVLRLLQPMAAPVNTNALTLTWSAVSWNPPISNYRVYQGDHSRLYTNVYDFATATQGVITLAPGTNYFAVTANITNMPNATGSGFSAELVYVPTAQKKTVVAVTAFTDGSADMVTWTNIYTAPTVYLTNTLDPAFLQFIRTRSQVTWWYTNLP